MSKENKRGFTIIEVSVAGLLIVVLGVGILGLQKLMTDAQLLGFVNYANVDEANFSVSQMAREMRTMRQGQNGSYPIVYGDNNDFSFYSDINFDGKSELVRYWLDGTTLSKSVTEPAGFPATYPPENAVTKPLTENVRNGVNPAFLYFNEDWPEDTTNNPLATPVNIADVRLVRVTLDINVNPENAERSVYSLSTNVNLRMLKDNL
jgi:type II secretory pathway pseudopilin PulG